MRGRVVGGSRNVAPFPGKWTCPGCLRPGCCFRCGTARPNSPLPPRPVPSNSCPARAPREQRHPGRAPSNAASGCSTERRPSLSRPPQLPPLLWAPVGGLSLDTVLQFRRTLNMPPTGLVELEKSGSSSCSQEDGSGNRPKSRGAAARKNGNERNGGKKSELAQLELSLKRLVDG